MQELEVVSIFGDRNEEVVKFVKINEGKAKKHGLRTFIGKFSASLKSQRFGEDERIIAVEEKGCDLLLSVSFALR
jgi:hypothetical protein